MRSDAKICAIAATLALFAGPALADSIAPSTFSATVAVGGKVTLDKTVTVTKGLPTTAKADVFFVTDTTGSMGGSISSVKSGFGSIASSLSGLGDFAYGAAEFKDTGDAFTYKMNQDITTSLPTVQTAINTWSAGGGGDFPEQALYALDQTALTASWRSGAKRIIVLAGDAPAKTNLVSQAQTQTDLINKGVTVESIDVGGGGLNSSGQFSGAGSIYAGGVAGSYFTGITPATLVTAITDAIGSAFANYGNVTLEVVGAAPGVGVTFTPLLGYSGAFDRSIDRTFGFNVEFTGLTVGVHDFTINALVDGGIIATESDRITVTGDGVVPEPATWAMMILGFASIGAMMRHRRQLMTVA